MDFWRRFPRRFTIGETMYCGGPHRRDRVLPQRPAPRPGLERRGDRRLRRGRQDRRVRRRGVSVRPPPLFFGCIQEETSCIKTEHFSDKDMCPRKTNESSKYTSRNIARKIIVGVRYVWVAYRFGDTTLALEQIVDPCGAGAQPSLAGKAGWYVRSGHKVSHSDNASLGVSPSIFSW